MSSEGHLMGLAHTIGRHGKKKGRGKLAASAEAEIGRVAIGAAAALVPVIAKYAATAAKRHIEHAGAETVHSLGNGLAHGASKVTDTLTSEVGLHGSRAATPPDADDQHPARPSHGDDGASASDRRDAAVPGVGEGRRMPVQQSMDVGVPLETCYNQWTQFEEWPTFMQRVTRVTQQDPTTVTFTTKIWSISKEFEAKILTQWPDERIVWRVDHGIAHTGVVTFHELGPQLTRVLVNIDVEPGSLVEKAARGMRHIKRAVRADMHRFKAFIEMRETETGAWRGVIEDGEVVDDGMSNGADVDENTASDEGQRSTAELSSTNGSSQPALDRPAATEAEHAEAAERDRRAAARS